MNEKGASHKTRSFCLRQPLQTEARGKDSEKTQINAIYGTFFCGAVNCTYAGR